MCKTVVIVLNAFLSAYQIFYKYALMIVCLEPFIKGRRATCGRQVLYGWFKGIKNNHSGGKTNQGQP